ncbi:MAG: hypothetical protein FJ100_03220 [Deltaproteobacteria bacterium]|nr:hypothetical protein [Deltaproteobacteria bacterium]
MRSLVICAAAAAALVAAPVLGQQAVLPLRVMVDTTADWTRVEVRGALVHAVGHALQVAGPAEVATPILQGSAIVVRKPVRDLSRVRLTVDFAALPTGDPLQVHVTRGDAGGTAVQVTSAGGRLAQDRSSGKLPLVGNLRILDLTLRDFGRPLPRKDWGRRVLAFYYGWWGTPHGPAKKWQHWDPAAPHKGVNLPPKLGLYDSLDGGTLHMHTTWAKQAGIDTLVMSVWQRDARQDAILRALLDAAEHDGLSVSAYLEAADNHQDLRKQLEWLVGNDMRHPAWLTVHGLRVVFLYTRIFDKVDADGYRKALDGLPVLAIGDRMQPQWLDVLGGLHSYVSFVSPASYADELRLGRQHARLRDKLVVATVMPGYDDSNIRFPGTFHARRDGDMLRDHWQIAQAADWVVLTSFNELHEGSEIEPTEPEGDLWLRRMRGWADAFKGRSP